MDTNPILVLAAGMGVRFGGTTHKCLAPLQFGEGSLQRLLRQLIRLQQAGDVWIVAGHEAPAVCDAARAVLPTVRTVTNPDFANGSLLASLAVGLEALGADDSRAGAWVFFADTVYRLATLETLFSAPRGSISVACMPPGHAHDRPVGLRFDPAPSPRLTAIGPDVAPCDGVMAPAVFWPRASWSAVIAAAASGRTAQWQALQVECARRPVSVIRIDPDGARDIDTADDLRRQRSGLVGAPATDYFRRNISKDERNLVTPDRIEQDRFTKICASDPEARVECDALHWLGRQDGEALVPRVFGLEGRHLTVEFVRGIRLYDLFRLLGDVPSHEPPLAQAAEAAADTLMRRSLDRLVRIQQALMEWPLRATRPPYPFDAQVGELVRTLLVLLELPALSPRGEKELVGLAALWEEGDAVVPFRDATPKNIVVDIPQLAPHREQDEGARLAALTAWLGDDGAPTDVRLVDYDFTSTGHLTAPEDDLLSLLGHQGSVRYGSRVLADPAASTSDWLERVVQLPATVDPSFGIDPARTARALLVRYLRFGGRKLIYRILNPAAHAVRFRYDSPQYYFDVLPGALSRLDPSFPDRWPELFSRLGTIAEAIRRLPPWKSREADVDFYRERLGHEPLYWQQSPAEHLASPSGGPETAIA